MSNAVMANVTPRETVVKFSGMAPARPWTRPLGTSGLHVRRGRTRVIVKEGLANGRLVSVTAERSGEQALLLVSDEGRAIPGDQLEAVFGAVTKPTALTRPSMA